MPPRRKAAPKSPAGPAGNEDPRAPLDGRALLAAARPVLERLAADLLERAKASPAVTAALEAQHHKEHSSRRTADPFPVWRTGFVDQVAAAWLLSCVFVRTLEDRGLLAHARLAGPGAADSQRLFFEMAPSLGERDYLLAVFREMCRFPAARALFDAAHNPVWMLAPSSEAAKGLLALFRAPSAEAPSFRFGQADTRFLGDLYQDLNEAVQKRYALLQTPRFVESFILDRTLERAIERFGLEEATVIDPTCGSGHFLLGAFERLYDHRLRAEPGLGQREAARKALDAVFGADINPYAAAIARFRLSLSFLEKAGFRKIAEAPVLPLHVVVADSLLHNAQLAQASFHQMEGQSAEAWGGRSFALEDEREAREVLHRRYAAVVGNPPYITVKDPVLRERYRAMYSSAFRSYSLGVPFTQRFFQLARDGGSVGMITANSFMKREFGKKLIEEYLPGVNLDLIVNTSGAYIPGHGTPTVLLFGTAETPLGNDVLAVLAKRGEPTTPEDPEKGLVWNSIVEHWREVGFENEFVSVARVERGTLKKHPWSLGGGGAAELKELLEERAEQTLEKLGVDIGTGAVTREDDLFLVGSATLARWNVPPEYQRTAVVGENVRDWSLCGTDKCLWPYSSKTLEPVETPNVVRALWPWRTQLRLRVAFGKTQSERGLPWFGFSMFFAERAKIPSTIGFAFVATHNHFVLDQAGSVFSRTAPIIKLPGTASEDDHLALLAYLNSSTACFWMKQVMMNKGATSDKGVLQADEDKFRFEFDGTKMREVPLPPDRHHARLIDLARRISEAVEKVTTNTYARSLQGDGDGPSILAEWERLDELYDRSLRQAVAWQEEVDWLIYDAFDLDPRIRSTLLDEEQLDRAEMAPGTRPFLAKHERAHLGPPFALRHEITQQSDQLRLLETAEYKRRWYRSQGKFNADAVTNDTMKRDAFESVVLDTAEAALRAHHECQTLRTLQRAIASSLERFNPVATALFGMDAWSYLVEHIGAESVPYLAAHRYTDAGLEKRALWERTWEMQRAEDRGEAPGEIPVPPKYDQKDYRDPVFWRLRGKLDVPKERFISYPGCESDEDGEPVYGWAGWTHLQQAQALAALYQKRKTEEAWDRDRLTPMLAGLLELLPWIRQWHNAPSEEYAGMRLGDFFEGFLEGELRALSLTRDDLRAFRPTPTRSRKSPPKPRTPRRPARDEEGEGT